VGEAQEIERLRLAQAPRRPVRGGEPPELDQPGLARVQFQAELRQARAKNSKEPPRILLVLEPDDEVVSLCRGPDYADQVGRSPGQSGELVPSIGIILLVRL
jgi:hypothetical protein